MKNIEDINKAAIKKIVANKKITEFYPGDTIKVGVKIIEGKRERIQYFEGVCIAKKNRDINSSFTVRKISFGEGVERTFALYSPNVDSIKVIRSGKVRRAKLYYLRDRKGKSARIAEKIKKKIGVDVSVKTEEPKVKPIEPATQETIVVNAWLIKLSNSKVSTKSVLNSKDLSLTEISLIPSYGFLICSTPSFKVFSVLNTAHFDCIVFCICSLSSDVFVDPSEFLILSNLSRHLSVSDFETSSCGLPGFTNSAALFAAALPKTTKSIKEFDPNLLAP